MDLTKIFIFLLIIALICIFLTVYNALKKMNTAQFSFSQHNITLQVELAENPFQWSKGLMYKTSLDQDKGMLFIFPNETYRSFWMKNTKIPLDLIFISKDKKIVDIKENFLPCLQVSCSYYKSNQPAKYVLEVNAGFVQKNQILIGEEINF